MSLKYAILGLLSFKPQTGYEIKANFNQSIRYLWNADQAQIYRTLANITQTGLAISHAIPQLGKPGKKVYELTEAGKNDLQQWLSQSLKPREQRNAELVQIFFAGQINDGEILVNFKRARKSFQADLARLESLARTSELFARNNSSARVHFFFAATLQLGIKSVKLNLDWVEEVIEKIENGSLPPA